MLIDAMPVFDQFVCSGAFDPKGLEKRSVKTELLPSMRKSFLE